MTVESSNPAPRRAPCELFVIGGGPARYPAGVCVGLSSMTPVA